MLALYGVYFLYTLAGIDPYLALPDGRSIDIASRYTQGLDWTTEALRRKELLEKEYFQYRIASDALARLLEGYSEDRARVVPQLDAKRLPDVRVSQAARLRSIYAARQMATEMDRLRKLPRQN